MKYKTFSIKMQFIESIFCAFLTYSNQFEFVYQVNFAQGLKVLMKQPQNHLFCCSYKNENHKDNMKGQAMGLYILEILPYKKVRDNFLQVFTRECGRSNTCYSQFRRTLSHPRVDQFQRCELFFQFLCLLQDLDQIPAVRCYILSFKCCNERGMVTGEWDFKLGQGQAVLSGQTGLKNKSSPSVSHSKH